MLDNPLKFFVPFYTVLGIMSIKKVKTEWKISKFWTFVNVVRMPISLGFLIFLASDVELRNRTFKNFVLDSPDMSMLSKYVMLMTSLLVYLSTFVIGLFNFSRRSRILSLIQDLSKIELDEEYSSKLDSQWKRYMIFISCFFLVVNSIQFGSNFKVSLQTILISISMMMPYVVMTSFMAFTKAFELLFVILLQDFRKKFTRLGNLEVSAFDIEASLALKKNFGDIFRLYKDFQDIFGVQLTMMTSNITISTTLLV